MSVGVGTIRTQQPNGFYNEHYDKIMTLISWLQLCVGGFITNIYVQNLRFWSRN